MQWICSLLSVSACLPSVLLAQVPLQTVEFRASTFNQPSLQILIGAFSGRSTGDVLITEGEVFWGGAANQVTSTLLLNNGGGTFAVAATLPVLGVLRASLRQRAEA